MKDRRKKEVGALSGAPGKAEQSKMGKAASKAWETRRSKYGDRGKKSSARKQVERESKEKPRKAGAEGGAEKKFEELSYDELMKGYRSGFLVLKGKGQPRKGKRVPMSKELREYLDFLYSRRWLKDVVFEKCWSMAKEVARAEIWGEVEDQVDSIVVEQTVAGAVVEA